MIIEVFYNPRAGRDAEQKLQKLPNWFPDARLSRHDITTLTGDQMLPLLHACDCAIIAGGDGTLHHFVNAVDVATLPCDLYFYPIGSGNDFAKDMGHEGEAAPFAVKQALSNLPTMIVNGRTVRFVNGAGVGLDGYVCKEGNLEHARTGKPVNYTLVAVKGLLFGFKPVNAKVTVDGITQDYQRVWLAPTMHGRYFGGGMMITPDQRRDNPDHTITNVVYHNAGPLFTMYVFPTIFKGKHVRFTKHVVIRTGHEVTVEFDRPCDMQVDGEIIENVRTYTVKMSK